MCVLWFMRILVDFLEELDLEGGGVLDVFKLCLELFVFVNGIIEICVF